MTLNIYRKAIVIAAPEIDDNTVFYEQTTADHYIDVTVIAPVALSLVEGDYILYRGEQYKINGTPKFERAGGFGIAIGRYTIRFEHTTYDLYNAFIQDEGELIFSYFGTPEAHLQLLINSMNAVQPGWTIAHAQELPAQLIDYSEETTCRAALNTVCKTFALEWEITSKTLTVKTKIGSATGLSFTYGRAKGLKNFTRTAFDETHTFNRVYGFGSDKNSVSGKRLALPEKYLEIEGATVIKEGYFHDDEIYPARTGTIANATDTSFTDSSIDFNLNTREGAAEVVFKSGALSGVQLKITSYDGISKKITFERTPEIKESAPAAGDTYTIVGITMPQSYIDAAIVKLREATKTALEQAITPKVAYELEFDENYLRGRSLTLHCGDFIEINDDEDNAAYTLRIDSITYSLVDPFSIKATISNFAVYSVEARQAITIIENQQGVREAKNAAGDAKKTLAAITISSKFITLTGEQVFSFSGDLLPAPDKEAVMLSAEEHNFEASPADRRWEYLAADGNWKLIVNSFNTLNLQVRHDSYIFEGRNSVTVRYRVGEVLDQLELVKLYAGQSALQVSIHSDFGDVFQNGNIDTVLRAEVSYGGELITDTLPESAFTWTRKSEDANADAVWNESHQGHKKEIAITAEDVWHKADFTCAVQYDTLQNQ